jgi:hypothetical protein
MLSLIYRGLRKADANAGKQAREADQDYTYENRTVPTQCEEDLVSDVGLLVDLFDGKTFTSWICLTGSHFQVIDTQLNRCVF